MNLEQLKPFTKSWTSPDGITFYMLPYRTLKSSAYVDEMNRLFTPEPTEDNPKPEPAWPSLANLFVACDSGTIDIEFPETLSAPLRSLQIYWGSRNGHAAHNWELYANMLSDEAGAQWATAYEKTRDDVLPAPDGLDVKDSPDPDPNASSSANES